ncbi:hypothetical protein VNO80_13543 [Phaseolus coccineus]|uniref:Secreted protein n=1 Tax=Phaseolus coccineus TaxID=3886 RepID=A0AAN9N1W4_PHACN
MICLSPLCLVFAICSSDQHEGDMTVIMISGPWSISFVPVALPFHLVVTFSPFSTLSYGELWRSMVSFGDLLLPLDLEVE